MKQNNKKVTLQQFIYNISRYQKEYWYYQDLLEKPGITATEVEYIHNHCNYISEKFVRFILDRNINVEILNNYLLDTK